jgi:hypothetical protein
MTQSKFKTALIIGGTGMLAEASAFLSERSVQSILIARHASSFAEKRTLKRTFPVDLDYRDTDVFINTLTAQPQWNTVDVVLLWMHDNGKSSTERLLELLQEKECLVIHVLGSGSGDPRLRPDILAKHRNGSYRYCTVVLGAMEIPNGRRWLNDSEISNGVITALEKECDVTVGVVR